ncbi:uncharacterized protein [Primulina eburnea]|uniref:uncharacterized protein isoform X2 n=1 Tax=Primulina eburnea TaxID=1245227 RepID=UPI003C6BE7A8
MSCVLVGGEKRVVSLIKERLLEVTMYRQVPSTNQRLKEIKVKHVWKICLFLGVCFWLIYQVKPSHDEKKGFDESDVKGYLACGHSNSFVKLGRKGVHSRVEEMTMEDVEESKHEEDGLEDIKDQENGSGGDETFDAEVDRENSVHREREGEESVENENEEKDLEYINYQIEKETDHDGDDTSSHEAREEHYKADDASSAVSHEIQMAGTGNENEHDENSKEQIDNILKHEFEENSEETDEGEKRKELEVEIGEMVKDDTESDVTYNETEENMGSTHHLEMSESESEYAPETLTEDTSTEDLNLQDTDLEKANYSTLNVDNNHLDSESTDPDETRNLQEIQQDSTDSSDSSDFSEEKETEGTNSEDAA